MQCVFLTRRWGFLQVHSRCSTLCPVATPLSGQSHQFSPSSRSPPECFAWPGLCGCIASWQGSPYPEEGAQRHAKNAVYMQRVPVMQKSLFICTRQFTSVVSWHFYELKRDPTFSHEQRQNPHTHRHGVVNNVNVKTHNRRFQQQEEQQERFLAVTRVTRRAETRSSITSQERNTSVRMLRHINQRAKQTLNWEMNPGRDFFLRYVTLQICEA